eukprot:4186357-Prymnesium_polylepis.1
MTGTHSDAPCSAAASRSISNSVGPHGAHGTSTLPPARTAAHASPHARRSAAAGRSHAAARSS